jgi:hypothetical protein
VIEARHPAAFHSRGDCSAGAIVEDERDRCEIIDANPL